MLHRAQFGIDPIGNVHPIVQMGNFLRACNLERENIINVQEQSDGSVILFYWQEVYYK